VGNAKFEQRDNPNVRNTEQHSAENSGSDLTT